MSGGAVDEPLGPTVEERSRDAMAGLTTSCRKVARALLADYPSAGLGTVADLAAAAGVSAPSVLRFAQALGFTGFSALQVALRGELTLRSKGPLSRIHRGPDEGPRSGLLVDQARELVDRAVEAIGKVPQHELDATVALLADPSRRLFLAGGRFSGVVADYLALNLQQMRPKVRLLDRPEQRDLGVVLELTRRDVVLLCDFRRYQRNIVQLAHDAHQRGATLILVTDEDLSPAAVDADVVLQTTVESPSAFDSIASALVLCELLLQPVYDRLGDSARRQMGRWETLRSRELLP